MLVRQRHLDVPYGKQAEAVSVMRAWGAEKFAREPASVVTCSFVGTEWLPSASTWRSR